MAFPFRSSSLGRPWLAAFLTISPVSGEPFVIPVGPGRDIHTLSQALASVQSARAERPQQAIDVLLDDGTYTLDAPLVMGPEHGGTEQAPVRWKAAPGARPVLSGGVPLPPFTPAADGNWQSSLPPGDAAEPFAQLWVNGSRVPRARHPNQGFLNPTQVTEQPVSQEPAQAQQHLFLSPEHCSVLRGLSADELSQVEILAFHKWDNTRRFLHALDLSAGSLTLEGPPMKPHNPLNRGSGIILENVRTALDAPGEWFLASDRRLTYKPRPGEEPRNAIAIAPRLQQLLILRGTDQRKVSHISFEGLSFRHAGWNPPPQGFGPQQAAASVEAVIQADHAEHLTWRSCEIAHTGLYGLWLRRGCRENRIEKCLFQDLGAGAIRIGTQDVPPTEEEKTRHNFVDNNILRDGGHVFPCAVGLWIGQSGDNQITHNEISHFKYTGVSVGWRWGYGSSDALRNRIDFNHIHHIGDGTLSDMGGIYTLGRSTGTTIRHNHVHHVFSYTYGGWGLYNDEGSSGIVLENNLVHHTKSGGYHQHYGKENLIANNIFAFAAAPQLAFTRAEQHFSLTFTRNIVLWETGHLLGGKGWAAGTIDMNRNLYWQTAGRTPIQHGTSWDAWREKGHDTDSLFANPGFRAPEQGDWTLPRDSPALGIGFQPFDPSQAGVYGDDAWKQTARDFAAP